MTGNWWTQVPDWAVGEKPALDVCTGRVRFWLIVYPELSAAIRDGCAIDASEDSGGGSSSDMTWWERYVTTKADLDIALRHCSPKQQRAVKAKFHTGLSYRDAARRLGKPKSNVARWCSEAVNAIAKRLSGEWDKTW